ncbi:hypothetical protein [Bacillus sp. V5-8f]|uniref:hypothetical protein n=1 Tax=Bacillus sp. V5-8f TaxID=2053044 RepID=UPI0015E11E31|nr:hypothetical protein [Bacillus sp. V5-8f]
MLLLDKALELENAALQIENVKNYIEEYKKSQKPESQVSAEELFGIDDDISLPVC